MKKQGLETVTIEEYVTAEANYHKYNRETDVGPYGSRSWGFFKFIGMPIDGSPENYGQYLYPADTARRIRLLAGPHWRTVLKAHHANQKACNHR